MYFGVVTGKGLNTRFKGFIHARTIKQCEDKLRNLIKLTGINYRLYGYPFNRNGTIIYSRRRKTE